MSREESIRLDIAELEKLLAEAERPKVKALIEGRIAQLHLTGNTGAKAGKQPTTPPAAEKSSAKPTITAPAAAPKPASSSTEPLTLDKYSWDQTDTTVKCVQFMLHPHAHDGLASRRVFVFHDELSKTLPTDKIDCYFTKDSFNLKVPCSMCFTIDHSATGSTKGGPARADHKAEAINQTGD